MPPLDDNVCVPLKLFIKYGFAFVRNVMFLAALVEVNITVLLLAPKLPN